ncbi:Fe-S protein assembly co-chaperone HscB [Pedobacter sp. HMF7056]|uniref:Fe-S protein assembly co-chaperone HscB n=2 Tax=Hufsiella ginkgonis TaxID=2695274 RepID=A0A7K1XW34_9SPHI|nr:Fe-S protein assembly co-chaperone HscB [Hufsiella ginkgonis]MXV15037.1 Fe-S protein assembly co-chaperone HscB [Hufsiella ginkgonis]
MDYFSFYDLPVSFNPDVAYVKRKFYELSKVYHPDFYINEPAEKQQEILELSTLNNRAYQVLSDPRKRLAYILEVNGLLEEGEKYQLPPAFLMEMMEVNEALMELEMDPDDAGLVAITVQVGDIEANIAGELALLMQHFDENTADKGATLLQIKDLYYRQKYLLRIRDTLSKFAAR